MASELQAVGGVLIPFPAAAKNPITMFFNMRKLARLIIPERVDIVHARSRAPAWVSLYAAHAAERPLVTTYHGAYGGRSALKLGYNSVMARGDVVIANSQLHRRRDRPPLSVREIETDASFTAARICARSRPVRSSTRGWRGCATPGASRRTSASCCSPRASPPGRARKC